MKHPADGLYYLTGARADELGACHSHLRAWRKRHPDDNERVPITADEMLKQERSGYGFASSWCLRQMRYQEKTNPAEHYRAMREWSLAVDDSAEVKALMDTLLRRAKREGLVPRRGRR